MIQIQLLLKACHITPHLNSSYTMSMSETHTKLSILSLTSVGRKLKFTRSLTPKLTVSLTLRLII